MEKNNKALLQDHEAKLEDHTDISSNIEELVSPYIFEKCIGTITGFDAGKNMVWVDFSGNPFGKPVAARPGRPFAVNDLQAAIDNGLDIKLEFEENNPGKPVVADIYYSILSERPNGTDNMELKDIYIRGRRVIIDADTEIVLQSGDVSVTCTAEDGKLVIKGVNISSEALHNNKIKGAAVAIN